jgi:hypothetical protein
MACLLDDAIVVSKASLESMFNEELVELRKGLEADLRSTDRHRRARRRVEHPRRHDDRRTGLALNEHDINPGAGSVAKFEAGLGSGMIVLGRTGMRSRNGSGPVV